MGRFNLSGGAGIAGTADVAGVVVLGTPGSDLAGAIRSAILAQAALQTPRYLAEIDLTGGSDDQRWFCSMVFSASAAELPNQSVDLSVGTFYGAEATALQASLNAALAAVPDTNTIRLMGFAGAGQGHPCVGIIISTDTTP